MTKQHRLFTFKDSRGGDITIDLDQITVIILPSFLALSPDQRNANVAAVMCGPLKLELTYDQVNKIQRALYDYYEYTQAPDLSIVPPGSIKTFQ